MQLVKYRLNIPYILLKKLSKACRLLPTNNERVFAKPLNRYNFDTR